jgi:hypothetical protein
MSTAMLHDYVSAATPQPCADAHALEAGDAIVVILKVPAAGQSKTRLHCCFGPDTTTQIAEAMAADTCERLSGEACAKARRVCCFAPKERRDEAARLAPGWELSPMAPRDLKSSDLGKALKEEYVRVRRQSRGAVVFLGSDAPDLPLDYVLDACTAARNNMAVVCEALDGGYVLIALPQSAPPEVFDGVKWSCAETCNSQRAQLQKSGVEVRTMMDRWPDVDEVTDVSALLERLKESKACPRVLELNHKLQALLAIWQPGVEPQPAHRPVVAPWAQPPAPQEPWAASAALRARLAARDRTNQRDPRGVPDPRLKTGRPPRAPSSLHPVTEGAAADQPPLPAFDAATAAANPTDWEDDDTVAPWAEFSAEQQAQRLADLEVFNAKTPPTSPSTVGGSPEGKRSP